MALSEEDRDKVAFQLGRETTCPGMTKTDVREAVAVMDEWLNLNLPLMFGSLPTGPAANAPDAWKFLLLTFVLMNMHGRLRTEKGLLPSAKER